MSSITLLAGPGDLNRRKLRLLACVFVIKPEFLIFGRIEMKVGYRSTQALSVHAARDDRDNRGYAKCAEPCEGSRVRDDDGPQQVQQE